MIIIWWVQYTSNHQQGLYTVCISSHIVYNYNKTSRVYDAIRFALLCTCICITCICIRIYAYIYYQFRSRARDISAHVHIYIYMHTLVRRADSGCVPNQVAPRWFFSMSLTVMLRLYTYILYRVSRLYRAGIDRTRSFWAIRESVSPSQTKKRKKEKTVGVSIDLRVFACEYRQPSIVLFREIRTYSMLKIDER